MTSSLFERLKNASTIKETSALDDSEFLGRGDNFAPTYVPMLNVALSGKLDGGVSSGLTIFAGESKRFKTLFTLICAKAYLDKYDDAVLLFYDSEFGTPQSYFSTVGIDTKRVIHSPITTVEQLRSDIAKQLDELKKGDHVFIAIDSFGNLASNKEVTDAINEKSVADMTRAKSIKSLFRIITPMLTLKDIPCIAVGHTYKTMEMYARDVVSGGCVVREQKIRMADGSLLEMHKIKVGDKVATPYGDDVVTHVWNPDTLTKGQARTIRVTFEDGSSVECSDNHPFLKNGSWAETKDLKIGDDIEFAK